MVRKGPGLILFTAVCLLFTAGAAGIFADGNLSMELNINNAVIQTRTADADMTPYWGWMTTGSSALSFKSTGNRNVKADLAFSFIFPEQTITTGVNMPLLTLDRAWIKARFPEFRITAGKTRLGWGDGFVFNSGDILFGSTNVGVDLTATEVRTETKWLTAVNIPIGKFTFIEAVAIAPPPAAGTSALIGKIENFSAGGRFYTKVLDIKVEAGYLFDNADGEPLHKTSLGLQGNILADWYLNASTAIPGNGEVILKVKDSLNLSAGLFYLVSLNSISSLNFRLEGLYRPFSSWSERIPADNLPFSDYGLLLYPEIGYSPNDSFSLSLRSIFSPIDLSAMLTAGGSWNVFEGFSINGYLILYAGDGDDLFAFDRASNLWQSGTNIIDGIGATIGINYIY